MKVLLNQREMVNHQSKIPVVNHMHLIMDTLLTIHYAKFSLSNKRRGGITVETPVSGKEKHNIE